MMGSRTWSSIALPVTALVAFAAVSVIIVHLVEHRRAAACADSYSFVNSHFACDVSSRVSKAGYASFQKELESSIAAAQAAGRTGEVSVYFRDLYAGPVFSINETADFAPASLLKLPIALLYLSDAERDPKVLEQQLVFTDNPYQYEQEYDRGERLVQGETYTVRELLRRMLSYSDNDAYSLLEVNLFATGQENRLVATYLELGILAPQDAYDEVVTVRRYASIFRILYNVSYLNPELSELVLEWLGNSSFREGLPAGTPAEVAVAHKFGERVEEDGVTKQLHDCGIVYYPGNPYLLCIMTRGDDFTELVGVIRDISRQVYEEVDSRRL